MKTFNIWSSDFLNTPLSQVIVIANTEKEARIKVRALGKFVDGDEVTNIKTIREMLESCGSSVYSGVASSNSTVYYNRRTREYEIWAGNQIACSGSYTDVMQELNADIQQSIVSELD